MGAVDRREQKPHQPPNDERSTRRAAKAEITFIHIGANVCLRTLASLNKSIEIIILLRHRGSTF